jgi:hypothetical protein
MRKAGGLDGRRQSLIDEVVTPAPRLSTLADALPVLISYVDADRRYAFNNREYGLVRARPARISGRPLREVVGDQAYAEIQPYVDKPLAARGSASNNSCHTKTPGQSGSRSIMCRT